MKIQVCDLAANPYRKIDHYPIDRAKIEALKTSIESTTFWDNVVARKIGNKFELAYGHHRWIALKELGIEEINIPVRDIDNATMLKIMAEENLNWTTSPAVINETVLAAKEFLDEELAKGWKDSDKNIRVLFESQHAFEQAMRKEDGTGRDTILKFLGKNWKEWPIQQALETLRWDNEGILDRKAIDILPKLRHAQEFKMAVKQQKIPKEKQFAIAKQLRDEIDNDQIGRRDIIKRVAQINNPDRLKKEDPVLTKLELLINKIDTKSKELANNIMELRAEMEKLNIKQVKGVKVFLAKMSLKFLRSELNQLSKE